MPTATLRAASLKLTLPLNAAELPRDIVPPDGPPGEPTLTIALEGTSLVAQARVNGRNYRRMLKQIDEQGAANVAVILQGTLRPPSAPGGPLVLDGAGFQVNVKTPAPRAEQGEAPAGGAGSIAGP